MALETVSRTRSSPLPFPADLRVEDNGMIFADGQDQLHHLWFRLVEREAGREYHLHRVVRLKMLRYLPQEARQDAGLLDVMRTALTGLYNQRRANFDPCMLVAGIFEPALGMIQCYGTVGIAEDRAAALRNADLGMAAVEGVMANFAQSRLEPLDIEKAEWMRNAFLEFGHSLVVIGQPDPRLSARGMGREGPGEKALTMAGETVYTMQQNEMLFRALARLQEEFLFEVLASRLAMRDLATMLEGIASEASVPASRQTGAKSITFGISFPLMASGALGQMAGGSYGRSDGESVSDSVGETDAESHTEGHATTVGHAVTDGWAHTEGHASTSGGSRSTSVTVAEGTSEGQADTVGHAHTVGKASTRGGSSSVSTSVSQVPGVTSVTRAQHVSVGSADMAGSQHSDGVTGSSSHSVSEGGADVHGGARTQGYDVGASAIIRGGWHDGVSETFGRTETEGTVDTVGQSHSSADGQTEAHTQSRGASVGRSVTHTPAHTVVSTSRSSSSFGSTTGSVADTDSTAHTESKGTSRSVARTTARSSFHSSTHSVADTTSHSETHSTAHTESEADSKSHAVSRSHGTGRSSATNVGRAASVARTMGMGAGVVPSVAASKSYQWYDDKAIQLTQILRAQEELLRQATLEGAYLTDAYLLCRTERGAAAAEAAVRQAFHGSEAPVVTPVQTRRLTDEEQAYIRKHAMCFCPSTREETVAGALEAYKDSTMLLPLQLAAYMAPALFEEGVAVTTQERIPSFAFVPDMGDASSVVLAHLWSTETGRLTSAQLQLSEDRMFHTAFASDTGYGKTIAAERLAVETTKKWKYRTVVLDFGSSWRKLLNVDLGEPGRVEVWQVFPGATVPIRWNPLQIGRRVNPERQMRATCELVRNAGQMGPRQYGFMRRALRKLYLRYGVLTTFGRVMTDTRCNTVRDAEWDVINAARAERGLSPPRRRQKDLHLADLEPCELQALAVHRSQAVNVLMWHQELQRMFDALPKNAATDRTSLEGVLLRVEPFAEGDLARMYGGQAEDSLAIEELGMLGPPDDPWGISILEGGAEMDEFAKAVIFSLIAWHLYNDAIVRRRLSIGRGSERQLQIFFEEANKVLTGIPLDSGDRDSAAMAQTSAIWETMWRDGRQNDIWLHVIAQTVSALPAAILSSSNNAFFSQNKNPRDRDLIMAHLAFSEKGFVDEDYKRFISRMAQKMAICKLGYSDDTIHTTPFLCRPVMVPAEMPTEADLQEHHDLMEKERAARKRARP